MENEKIDWKTKNTYQKLVYVSAEISKQGIRPTGIGAHASKYYDMKDFVPTAMRLGGEVGLAFIYDFKVEDEKAFAELHVVNADNPDDKTIVTKCQAMVPQGTNPGMLMQAIGIIRTYTRRYLLRDILNIAEADPVENMTDTDGSNDTNDELLQPVSEKTKNELTQLLEQFDDIKNDVRVADIAQKDLSKMNEGWARFAIKTLKNILEEQEDVPYDDPKPVVVEVGKELTHEQMAELRNLYKECKNKRLCPDVINELKRGVSNLTYDRCEKFIREMQEALNENKETNKEIME